MQQDLSTFFEEFISRESIFKDRSVLTSEYHPGEVLHRNEQVHAIAQMLAPCLRMEKPSNIFIYGKTGTGKTVTVTHTTHHILQAAQQHHVNVKVLYVNCKMKRTADTEYRLLAEFTKQLGTDVPATGLPTDEVYNIFINRLDAEKRIVILVLDEVDELVRKSDALFYNLTRVNSDLKQARVTIVGIANNASFTDHLDPRVKSSLGEEELIFPSYNAPQIRDILEQRTRIAFNDNVVEPGVIEKCAAFAARDHGDARRAIELMRVAGEIAERNGFRMVKMEHLDEAEGKIERDRMLDLVRKQPKQYQLVLYGILSLSRRDSRTVLSTGEVYELYQKLCSQTTLRPLTQRRISDIIAEFDMLGVINVKVISKGRYGRTRDITIPLPGDTAANLKKLVAQSLDLPS